MKRKWFALVDSEGRALSSKTSVYVDTEDVDAFRKVVRTEFKDNHLAGIAASDLAVFANRAAFDAKRPSEEDAPIGSLGGSKEDALFVQAPSRMGSSAPGYFILPESRELLKKSVFVVVDDGEKHTGAGFGVFFTPTLAVTCDHNLTDEHVVGSDVTVALKGEMATVEVVARNPDLDFAILKSSTRRPFVPPWSGSPEELEGRNDLVLTSFRLGIEEFDVTKNQLGFAHVATTCISRKKRHVLFSCTTFAGDSGAALVVKQGLLVGIHQETVNALREQVERKKTVADCLTDVEESLDAVAKGFGQGCIALLVHEFKDVVSE